MIQKTLVRAACLAAVLLALTGCQNTVNTLSGGPGVTAADLKRFTSDSFCRDRLEVMAVNMAQTDGGMRQLQVTLRSERYGFFPEIWSLNSLASRYLSRIGTPSGWTGIQRELP